MSAPDSQVMVAIHESRHVLASGGLVCWLSPWLVVSETANNTDSPGWPLSVLLGRMAKRAARAYGHGLNEFFSTGRAAPLTKARAAVVWALRQMEPPPSFERLARLMGRSDHGTTMAMHRRAESLRETPGEIFFRQTCTDPVAMLPRAAAAD